MSVFEVGDFVRPINCHFLIGRVIEKSQGLNGAYLYSVQWDKAKSFSYYYGGEIFLATYDDFQERIQDRLG